MHELQVTESDNKCRAYYRRLRRQKETDLWECRHSLIKGQKGTTQSKISDPLTTGTSRFTLSKKSNLVTLTLPIQNEKSIILLHAEVIQHK